MWFTSLLVTLAPNLCTLWQWWSSPSQPDCREGWWVVRRNRGGLTHILKGEICFITRLQRAGVRIQERGKRGCGGGDSFHYRSPKQKAVPVVTDCFCKCLWCSEWRCESALQLIKSETYRDTLLSLQTLIPWTHKPIQIHSFLLQIGVPLQKMHITVTQVLTALLMFVGSQF